MEAKEVIDEVARELLLSLGVEHGESSFSLVAMVLTRVYEMGAMDGNLPVWGGSWHSNH
jgi:hypothetical protein